MEPHESSHIASERQSRHRESLVQTHHAASESFDKTIITLSAAALATSIGFVRDVAPAPAYTWSLITSWAMFGASLVFILVSFLTSLQAHERMIAQIDEDFEDASGGFAAVTTHILNVCAAMSLVSGVVFVVIFASLNIG